MSDLSDRIDIAAEQMKEATKVFRMLGLPGAGRLSTDADQPDVWQFMADRLGETVAIYVTDPALKDALVKRFEDGGRLTKLVALTSKPMIGDQVNGNLARPAYLATKLAREFA